MWLSSYRTMWQNKFFRCDLNTFAHGGYLLNKKGASVIAMIEMGLHCMAGLSDDAAQDSVDGEDKHFVTKELSLEISWNMTFSWARLRLLWMITGVQRDLKCQTKLFL